MLKMEFEHIDAYPEPTYVRETTFWWSIIIIGIIIIILIIFLIIRGSQIYKLNNEVSDLKKQISSAKSKKEISLEDISEQLLDLKNEIKK